MKVGDKIIAVSYGVNATEIPVGAIVQYDGFNHPNGGQPPHWIMEVEMRQGVKVLAFPDSQPGDVWIHGQQGTMTILSLPDGWLPSI